MKVKVYSTQMGEKEIDSQATTWGELQRDLLKASINYSGMKTVIGETKLTLEADAAVLPDYDFTLFLMPVKTKSGIAYEDMKYKELRSTIKKFIEEDKEEAEAYFNKGRNYTTKSTEDLRDLLLGYDEQEETEKKVASPTIKKEKKKDKKKDKKEAKKEVKQESKPFEKESVKKAIQENVDEDKERNETEHLILKNLLDGTNLLKKVDVQSVSPQVQAELEVYVGNLDFLYLKLAALITKNGLLAKQYKAIEKEFAGLI